jgi:hypothetical protein
MTFWEKQIHLELLDDEQWLQKVTNPDTNTYYQIADLPVAYRKFDENKKYPIRQVLQIVRIKRVDGTEWLTSKGRLVGLDRAGNEVEHSFGNPEPYYRPITRHEVKKRDPKNEYSPTDRKCVEAAVNPADYRYTKYTLPFKQRTLIIYTSRKRQRTLAL